MQPRRQKQNDRQAQILQLLEKQERVSVAQLSALLETTEVTIRSDLSQLERDGKLMRVHGGAVRIQTQLKDDRTVNLVAKETIAALAAQQIQDGDTIFINSGTTSVCVARALKEKQSLNIVTNAIDVALELADVPTFRVLLLGGEINARYGFTYGGDAQEQLRCYQANWAILSVDGVSLECGITTYHAEEAILDRMMIAGARGTLIVADSSKIGRAGFTRVIDCMPDLTLVTDAAAEYVMSALSEADVQIIAGGR